MFGISFGEIIIILLVALIFIKPEEIPTYVKSYKDFLKKLKLLQRNIQTDLSEELDLKEYTREINDHIKTIIGNDGKEYDSYELPKDLIREKRIEITQEEDKIV